MHRSISALIQHVEKLVTAGLHEGLVIALSSPVSAGEYFVPYNERYFYVTYPGEVFEDEIVHEVTANEDLPSLQTLLKTFCKNFHDYPGDKVLNNC